MVHHDISDPGHTQAAVLDVARSEVGPELRSLVATLPEPLRLMARYHFGWRDPEGRPTASGSGKHLRSAVLFAVSDACRGGRTSRARAAAAVELVHNFSLVHDDIMDRDLTRRGRRTIWAVWGEPDAVLLGDALLALALRGAAECGSNATAGAVVRLLTDATVELCRGQHEDCAFETAADIDVSQYSRMVDGKTGALMGCAAALGAVCAEAPEPVVSAFAEFGRKLGAAFQFADDVLGIWGDTRHTGKAVGSDLHRRKRSLPVLLALNSATPEATELRRLYSSDMPLGASGIARAEELIERVDGRARTQRYAAQMVEEAVEALPLRYRTAELIALGRATVDRTR